MTFSVTLPWPPSVNHYWMTARTGAKYLSARAKQFRADALAAVRERLPLPLCPKFTGPVSIQIGYWLPDKRRRDWDNPLKPIGDVLEHSGVILDDSQIRHGEVRFLGQVKGGAVEIVVEPFDETNQRAEGADK